MKSAKQSVPSGAAGITVPFEITLPEDTPEYMAPAYFSCLQWASGFEPILNQFREDTGKVIPAVRAPIEKMIDDATGFDPYADFLRVFVPWFNEWIWGAIDGPGEEN
jgi:hypothetical protein